MAAGAAVMNDEAIPCPATLAHIAIANKNRLAVTTKAATRVRGPEITATAQSRAMERKASAVSAEEAGLSQFHLNGQDS